MRHWRHMAIVFLRKCLIRVTCCKGELLLLLHSRRGDQQAWICLFDDYLSCCKMAFIITTLLATEWEKVWSRLSAHLQPLFRLSARILTIFDRKYCILMCRDKRESYLIVLQQNNVLVCLKCKASLFFVTSLPNG